MWNAILEALFQILKLLESFTRDWGLAIVLMTLLFRIIIWPLTTKQVKSTVHMQKLQPKLKELQDKYANDKQKQSEEMMKLYQENKISPLSGCLPMLLQLPLLIAFYSMLSIPRPNAAGKLVGTGGPLFKFLDGLAAPFLKSINLPGMTTEVIKAGKTTLQAASGFLPDIMQTPAMVYKMHIAEGFGTTLASLWPYVFVLVLFAVAGLVPLLMNPSAGSQGTQQKGMAVFMSIFMLWIGWNIPAGALLYYDVSSIFAAGQQIFLQRRMYALEQASAELISEPSSNKKGKKGSQQALESGSKKKK